MIETARINIFEKFSPVVKLFAGLRGIISEMHFKREVCES